MSQESHSTQPETQEIRPEVSQSHGYLTSKGDYLKRLRGSRGRSAACPAWSTTSATASTS